MGLPGVTGDKEGYKGLRGDYWRLQGVTEGYKGLWRSSFLPWVRKFSKLSIRENLVMT